ncbi:MAG: hypothetical protein FH753_07860 [Firmicutes bacterium]|nr:hypothetical protein [Bacillota bacterium]
MEKLEFGYPMMLFARCSCTNQVPIKEMEVRENTDKVVKLGYKAKCSICNKEIKEELKITEETKEFTDLMNVFKVIPSIKDELAIIKLETVKGKLKDGELKLFGNYSHLRFWDQVIQKDIITIPYKKI